MASNFTAEYEILYILFSISYDKPFDAFISLRIVMPTAFKRHRSHRSQPPSILKCVVVKTNTCYKFTSHIFRFSRGYYYFDQWTRRVTDFCTLKCERVEMPGLSHIIPAYISLSKHFRKTWLLLWWRYAIDFRGDERLIYDFECVPCELASTRLASRLPEDIWPQWAMAYLWFRATSKIFVLLPEAWKLQPYEGILTLWWFSLPSALYSKMHKYDFKWQLRRIFSMAICQRFRGMGSWRWLHTEIPWLSARWLMEWRLDRVSRYHALTYATFVFTSCRFMGIIIMQEKDKFLCLSE